MRPKARVKRSRPLSFEPMEARQVLSTLFVAPTGSDTNKGTTDAPFKTLQKAASVVKAGDTVNVRAGEYAGFIMGWSFPQTGRADAPILFHAEPGVSITSRNNKTPDGIDLEGVSYITIEGFKISNNSRAGIRSTWGDHVTIRNNVTDNNSRWGIYVSHDNYVTIEGNTTTNSIVEHGIYVTNSLTSPVVRNNIITGNAGNGIHMNGGLAEGGGDGMIRNALIEGNYIANNGKRGGSGINLDGVRDSVIRNNVLVNNHASGISIYSIDGGGPSVNDVVLNNTILMANDSKYPLNIQNGSTGTKVFNNILLATNPGRLASISISTNSLPGYQSDFNALMGKDTFDGSTLVTHAAYVAKTGQDAHSIVTSPALIGFVNANPLMADLHVNPNSVVVDAGTLFLPASPDTVGTTADLLTSADNEGQRRVRGRSIDIGAYESRYVQLAGTGGDPAPKK